MHQEIKSYLQAAALGLVAGMRSASAPALISNYVLWQDRPGAPGPQAKGTLRHFLSSPPVNKALRLFALAEMVVDKIPAIPKRTTPPSLIARTVSGGLAGAGVGSLSRRSAILTGLVGALSATGATYTSYKIRKEAAENTAMPDALLGLLEDFLILGISYSFRQEAASSNSLESPAGYHEAKRA